MSDPIQVVAVELCGELVQLHGALRRAQVLHAHLQELYDRRLKAEAGGRPGGQWMSCSERLRVIQAAGADVSCAVRRLGAALAAPTTCSSEEP